MLASPEEPSVTVWLSGWWFLIYVSRHLSNVSWRHLSNLSYSASSSWFSGLFYFEKKKLRAYPVSKRRWVCRCPKAILAFGTNLTFLLAEQKYQVHPYEKGEICENIERTKSNTFLLSSTSECWFNQHMEKQTYLNKPMLIWIFLNLTKILCVLKIIHIWTNSCWFRFDWNQGILLCFALQSTRLLSCLSSMLLQFKYKSRIWTYLKGENGQLVCD